MLEGKLGMCDEERAELLLALVEHAELRRFLLAGEFERPRGLLDPQLLILVVPGLRQLLGDAPCARGVAVGVLDTKRARAGRDQADRLAQPVELAQELV